MNSKDLDLSILVPGNQYTLVKESEFGYPMILNIKLDMVFLKDYAQYTNCIQIQGVLKGKRKKLAWLIKSNQFAIFDGYLTIDDFKDFRVHTTENDARVTDYGTCFSKGAIKKFIGNKKPILSGLN